VAFIIEILVEFLIQFFIELLVEVGAQKLKSDKLHLHPAITFVVYIWLGAGLGFLSGIFFQQRLLSHPYAQYENVAITPILVGLAISAIGSWRLKRGKQLVLLDKFLYGYTFALAFAIARYGVTAAG
jgi:hypothetical protein